MKRQDSENITHDPQGIIALCRKHHDLADGGAFTKAQLRQLKDGEGWKKPEGFRIDWFRENLIVYAGSFHINPQSFLRIDDREVVGFARDEENHLLLNVDIHDKDGNSVVKIVENDWIEVGGNEVNEDKEFLPHGHKFTVKHPDFSFSVDYKSCDMGSLPQFLWGKPPNDVSTPSLEHLKPYFSFLADGDGTVVVCRILLNLSHPTGLAINRKTSAIGGLLFRNSIFEGVATVFNYSSEDGRLRIGS